MILGMVAEQVPHEQVRVNSPIYFRDPIKEPTLPRYAGAADILPDTMVWVMFDASARYNPWLLPEFAGPMGYLSGLTHILDGFDENVR